jgi:hypothetical protein
LALEDVIAHASSSETPDAGDFRSALRLADECGHAAKSIRSPARTALYCCSIVDLLR